MFGLVKAVADPFDERLEAAQAIVVKREKVLGDILAAESRVADADEQIRTAEATVAAEEYAAAQEAGGLAVASPGAQKGLAEAKLAAKSCRLRLQGLQAQREKIEADLVPAWSQIEAFRDEFFAQRALELSEQADRAVELFRGLICQALAFRHLAGAHFAEKYGNAMARMIKSFTSNASSTIMGYRCSIHGGMFKGADGKQWALTQHWDRDPAALGFSEAVQAIDERIAPLRAIAAEVRPKE